MKRVLIVGAIAALLGGLLSACVPNPAPWSCSGGYVALTFDDGPGAYTTQLLQVLQNARVGATFFLVGRNVVSFPDQARAIRDARMVIGNHTYDHPHMPPLDPPTQSKEIVDTQNAIQTATGVTPQLFRFPFGDMDRANLLPFVLGGLYETGWSVETKDWTGEDATTIVNRAQFVQPGGIILMHVFPPNTVTALPQILHNLQARNLCPGAVVRSSNPIVMSANEPVADAWLGTGSWNTYVTAASWGTAP
jgi:peptidoglycan/xylan/chitin deacetylase (PgdA/CDA1 family)